MLRVILVVDPSGSGKDTLPYTAKEHFQDKRRLNFARRYITRPPDSNEDNHFVDQAGFTLLKENGFFVAH